ncbi:MAG: glutathione S-transferase family protein [Burkholderiales bacterium]
MKLHTLTFSSNSRKVVAVARHLNLPLEIVPVDLAQGEQRKPEFLKLNPNGKIPVLVDGDFVLWESIAIMEYLASKKPGTSLWPESPRARADISRWLCWTVAHWGPACGLYLWENMIKKMMGMGAADAARLKEGAAAFQQFATVLDDQLRKNEYLTGTNLTLADFAAAAWIAYSEPAQMPVAPYANIKRWYARISALPAWRDSAPS